jgi:hypothetical protein
LYEWVALIWWLLAEKKNCFSYFASLCQFTSKSLCNIECNTYHQWHRKPNDHQRYQWSWRARGHLYQDHLHQRGLQGYVFWKRK